MRSQYGPQYWVPVPRVDSWSTIHTGSTGDTGALEGSVRPSTLASGQKGVPFLLCAVESILKYHYKVFAVARVRRKGPMDNQAFATPAVRVRRLPALPALLIPLLTRRAMMGAKHHYRVSDIQITQTTTTPIINSSTSILAIFKYCGTIQNNYEPRTEGLSPQLGKVFQY